jgi:hypothetical protein
METDNTPINNNWHENSFFPRRPRVADPEFQVTWLGIPGSTRGPRRIRTQNIWILLSAFQLAGLFSLRGNLWNAFNSEPRTCGPESAQLNKYHHLEVF